MPKETSPHLLLGAQDQRLGAEQDHLHGWSTGNSHDSGILHDTTASPKTILQGTLECGRVVRVS